MCLPEYHAFVRWLERWRELIGFNQNEFAEQVLGVDASTWSVERRRPTLSPKFVGRVVLRYPWLARLLDGGPANNETCPQKQDDSP